MTVEKKWGQKGGPWEFNLRDLFRWCQLMLVDQSPGCYDPGQHVFLVYGERMRTREDKEKVSLMLHLSFSVESNSLFIDQQSSHKNTNTLGNSEVARMDEAPSYPSRVLILDNLLLCL